MGFPQLPTQRLPCLPAMLTRGLPAAFTVLPVYGLSVTIPAKRLPSANLCVINLFIN